jgi:hypothetical protein
MKRKDRTASVIPYHQLRNGGIVQYEIPETNFHTKITNQCTI